MTVSVPVMATYSVWQGLGAPSGEVSRHREELLATRKGSRDELYRKFVVKEEQSRIR
jgi:hypothetical protein